jgi:hypothetical protein
MRHDERDDDRDSVIRRMWEWFWHGDELIGEWVLRRLGLRLRQLRQFINRRKQ